MHVIVLEPDIEKQIYGDYYFLTSIEIYYPDKARDDAFVLSFELNVIRSNTVLPAGELPTAESSERLDAEDYMRPVLDMFQRMRFY